MERNGERKKREGRNREEKIEKIGKCCKYQRPKSFVTKKLRWAT